LRATSSPALFSLALGLGLSVSSAARAEGTPPFSHELHVTNFERACSNCHVASGPKAPEVDRRACGECHETVPAYAASKRVVLPRPDGSKVGVAFRHEPHVASIPCLDCHAAVLSPTGEPKAVMDRRQCAQCHSDRGLKKAEARCAACHGRDQRKVPPTDHTASWLKRHGEESRDRAFADHGQDCAMCHGADTCAKCHRERRPESHTGLWRVRLHGAAAEWDRDACKACHETGTCTRCHRTTRPINHAGSWRQTHGLAAGATDNQNCRVCHTAASCAACHRPGM